MKQLKIVEDIYNIFVMGDIYVKKTKIKKNGELLTEINSNAIAKIHNKLHIQSINIITDLQLQSMEILFEKEG